MEKENKKKIMIALLAALALILVVATGSYLYVNSLKDSENKDQKERAVNEEDFIEYEADAIDKKEEFIKKLPPRNDLSQEELNELKKNSAAGDDFVAPPKYE